VGRGAKRRCKFVRRRGGFTKPRSCKRRLWIRAKGRNRWRFAYKHPLPPGAYTLRARATDRADNHTPRTRRATQHFRIR
jgi:hypothetical protein